MSRLQVILVTLAAFVLVLHATAALDVVQDKELMNEGYQEIAEKLPPAAQEFSRGLLEALNNGDIDQEFLEGIGKIIHVLLEGVGEIAGGALGE